MVMPYLNTRLNSHEKPYHSKREKLKPDELAALFFIINIILSI